MRCKVCDRQVQNNEKFCRRCGTKIANTQEGSIETQPFQQVYHWANIIIIPLLGLLLINFDKFEGQSQDTAGYLAFGYTIISGLINNRTRGWIIKFFSTIFVSSLSVGWAGSIVGFIILIIMAGIIGTFGAFLLMAILWITSLVDIMNSSNPRRPYA